MLISSTPLSPDLLTQANAVFPDPAYADLLEDWHQDLIAGRTQWPWWTAHEDEVLVGVATASPPGADEAPWSVHVLLAPSAYSDIGALFDAAVMNIPAGSAIEWWVRGPLIEVASAFAERRNLARGRRIEVMQLQASNSVEAGLATRPFTVEDAARLAEVNNAAFAGHADRSAWTAETVLDGLHHLGNQLSDILVAPVDGPLQGFVWTRLVKPGVVEIYTLAAHPDTHGTGLGHGLLHAGIQYLHDTYNSGDVILYVDADNTHAIRLYERSGFVNANLPLVSFRLVA